MSYDNQPRASDIKCSLDYWMHGVEIPYTLKAQHRLAELVEYDDRLNRAARMVFHFIVDWDVKKHGDALASARFISAALKGRDPAGVGLSRSSVHAATALLAETGWITQTSKGTGPKNASRYQPSWAALSLAEKGEFPSIVANRPDSVDASQPSSHCGQYRPVIVDASAENRPVYVDKDSLTSDARTDAQTDSERDTRPPSAPDGAGPLGAAPPVSAVEGSEPTFNALLAAYAPADMSKPARRGYKKAWEAIEGGTDLAAVIEAASEWQASWAAQNKPNAPRMGLVRWLEDEMYLKPAPTGYVKTGKASKAKPAKPPEEVSRGLSQNIKRYKIIDHQGDGSYFADRFEIFTFEGEDGTQFTERMHILAEGTENADDAPDYYLYQELCKAAFGKGNPIGELIGRVVGVNGDVDGLCFHHLPEENLHLATLPEPEPVAPPTTTAAPPTPAGPQWKSAEVIDSRVANDVLTLSVEFAKGEEFRDYRLPLDDATGKLALSRFCKACGLDEIEDSDDLHGWQLKLLVDDDYTLRNVAPPLNARSAKSMLQFEERNAQSTFEIMADEMAEVDDDLEEAA